MIDTIFVIQAVLGLLVLFNLVVTLALVRRVNTGENERVQAMGGLPPGTVAPEFTAQTLEGAAVSHTSLYDQRVALVFVSSTCKPCREIMPELSRLAGLAAERGPRLVLVNVGQAAGAQEVAELSAPATVVTASQDTLATFGHPGTPHFVVIEEGEVETSGHPSSMNRNWKALVREWEKAPRDERSAAVVPAT